MLSLSRILIASLALLSVIVSGCQLDIQETYRDLVCEPESCFTCAEGLCVTYFCAEDHQCPMGRFCTEDNLCAEVIEPEGQSPEAPICDRNTDCAAEERCADGGPCSAGGTLGGSESSGQATATEPPTEAPLGGTEGQPNGSEPASGSSEGSTIEDERALPQHPQDLCVVNDDCGFTGLCLDGGCYFACDALGACPPDQRCDQGQCMPTESPEVICTFNGECGPDRVCIEGQCFETCGESLDCGDQMLCDAGLCVADTSPVIQCSGPGACADGEGCFDGKCLALCDGERPCAEGALCQFGYCHQKVTCTLSEQCPSGADCLDGSCN